VEPLDPELLTRLKQLCDDGWEIWSRFDVEVRADSFHPFVAADYERVLEALTALRKPGLRFLEWGSATGVITIMADLLGFEAYGIEMDEELVRQARQLATDWNSDAHFACGSFLPAGYHYRGEKDDPRLGTIGAGESGYLELGIHLDEFDVVYGFPWPGEEHMMLDLMKSYGSPEALLVTHGVNHGVRCYRRGRLI
jgi:SAM-dependent methyltransferase